MPRTGPSLRPALAALAFALAVCASYALQRLWDARTEPPLGAIVAQTTIPYTWRVATALLHGAGAAALVGLGVSEDGAARWLHRAPWLVAGVVLPAVLAMLAVP